MEYTVETRSYVHQCQKKLAALTGDRIYGNNELAVRQNSTALHLYPSWLKTWLSMVASTVKNGNNRLRKGNRCCRPWILRTCNEWIDLVVWLFVYYSIVGFEGIMICYCEVWQLWNQCPSTIIFLFRPFFTHLWALITEVYLLANSFIRKTKLDLQDKQSRQFFVLVG